MSKLLSGSWPTMVTPFDDRNRVDLDGFRAMIAWYLEKQVGGLYANCLSSEMYHLSVEERILITREAVLAANGKAPVASTGNLGADLDTHIKHCRQIEDTGVDVVMLVVPEFIDNDADLEHYYLTIAEHIKSPLGLYECPQPRRYHLGVELVKTLAQTGRFSAYKETSCSLEKIKAVIKAAEGTPLSILQANTPYMLEAIRAGSPGSMTIAAIWLPDLVAEVILRAQNGHPEADDLHARLCALKLAQRSVHPLGSKYLLQKRGVPIQAHGRTAPQVLPPETLIALDFAARVWFDIDGNLKDT